LTGERKTEASPPACVSTMPLRTINDVISFDSASFLRNNQSMIKFEKLPSLILSKIPMATEVLMKDSIVVFAYLFGGLAAGRVNPLSDVDIAVYVNDDLDLADYKLTLFDRITDALGTAEVDLIILNTAPISIAGRILQNKKLLVDKDPFKRHAYESLALREFFDFRVIEEALLARRYEIGR
jgi:predicted nucleotidyltransferase